jgi:O-antigen ligase
LLLALERRRLATGSVGALMALLGLGFVAAVSVEQGLGRFMTATSLDAPWDRGRDRVYGLSLDLFRSYRLTGTGLGTFRDAFPLVQTADLEGAWWHAHSDLLEVLVTTGIAGAALLFAGAWLLLARLAGDLRRRQHPEEKASSLAALGALAAVGLHESVDFGLTMPANALALAVLCGAALAPAPAPEIVTEGARG